MPARLGAVEAGDGRDRRPRRRRRRHRRREPQVHHPARLRALHRQLLRPVAHRQAEREHVRQHRPRHRRRTSSTATSSAATSAARSRSATANKLFFFVNHEVDYIPQTTTRETTVLTAEAQQGIFRYTTATGEQRTVNVYQMAAAAGLQSTPDPTIAALLAKQADARNYSTGEPGGTLRQEILSWREPQKAIDQFPTVRLDYQIKPNLAVMGSYNRRNQDQQGRRVWPMPGMPINSDTFDAGWWVIATGTNWTINSNLHNEMRFGIQHSGDTNEVGRQKEFFELNGIVNGLPARFQLPLVSLLVADNAPVIGKHYITTITDTFTMLRGNHTLTFGGNYRDTQWRDRSLDGAGTGGYLGLPRYATRRRRRRSGGERVLDGDDSGPRQRRPGRRPAALRAAHRPAQRSPHRQGRRSGDAPVLRLHLPRELDVGVVRGPLHPGQMARQPELHAEPGAALRDEPAAVQPHGHRRVPRRSQHLRTVDAAVRSGRPRRRGESGDQPRLQGGRHGLEQRGAAHRLQLGAELQRRPHGQDLRHRARTPSSAAAGTSRSSTRARTCSRRRPATTPASRRRSCSSRARPGSRRAA